MARKNSPAPASSLLESMRGPRLRQPLRESHEPALPKGGRKEMAKGEESGAAWGGDLTSRILKAAADAKLAVTHSRPLRFPLAIYA